ncbi:uncharacterized protein [Dysidea avara]|uniref:uncharacterized protein isoform X2 n=1 Tax=Dysidea avara TaxID=196820 RepID=UPI00331F9681
MRTTLITRCKAMEQDDPQEYLQASLNKGKQVIYYQRECYRRSYSCPNTWTATPSLRNVNVVKSDSIASDVDESDLASSQGGSTNSLTGGVDGGHTAKSAGDQQNLVSNEWGDDVFIPKSEASVSCKPTAEQPQLAAASCQPGSVFIDKKSQMVDGRGQLLAEDESLKGKPRSEVTSRIKEDVGKMKQQVEAKQGANDVLLVDSEVKNIAEEMVSNNDPPSKLKKGKLRPVDIKCVNVILKKCDKYIKEGLMKVLTDYVGEEKTTYIFIADSDKYLEILESLLESLSQLDNVVANIDVQPQEGSPTPGMNF